MNFKLSGVFKSNTTDAVNLSLWTVPYEMVCYGIMSALIIFGILRYPKLIVGAALAICFVGLIVLAAGFKPVQTSHYLPDKIAYFFFTDRGSRLFVAFLLGIAVYLWRHRIPYSKTMLAICLFVCAGVAVAGPAGWMSPPALNLLLCAPLSYLTAYIGVSDVPLLPLFHRGDYSYGIYLYAMPIQQAVAATFPSIRNVPEHLAITLPIVVIFAAFSWHCIEKPILRLRRRFSFVATVRGAELPLIVEPTRQSLTPDQDLSGISHLSVTLRDQPAPERQAKVAGRLYYARCVGGSSFNVLACPRNTSV